MMSQAFDEVTRFDAAEALMVLAHDYGLYAVVTHLETEAHFRPRPSLSWETLESDGRHLYRSWENRHEPANCDPYEVPDWADKVIREIVCAAPSE